MESSMSISHTYMIYMLVLHIIGNRSAVPGVSTLSALVVYTGFCVLLCLLLFVSLLLRHTTPYAMFRLSHSFGF